MKPIISLTCLLAFAAIEVAAWSIPTTSTSNRRDFLLKELSKPAVAAAFIAGSTSFTSPAFADDEEEAAAPSAPEPAPTPAVDDSENDFIAKLKAQSDAKRDIYKKQAQSNDKLSTRQFASQYDRPTYIGVYTASTGNVDMLLEKDVQALILKGKVEKRFNEDDDKYRYYYK